MTFLVYLLVILWFVASATRAALCWVSDPIDLQAWFTTLGWSFQALAALGLLVMLIAGGMVVTI